MKIIDITKTPANKVIKQTILTLEKGGLVLFPTETTYGAGVDATNQDAVNKLLSYKSRREGKPLSILVADKNMAKKYVEINDQASNLYTQFLPGPVTVVSKSLNTVAKGVSSEFGTLGIRIPDYPLLLKLSKQYNKPITATSANASGKKRPYSIQDILDGLNEKQKRLIDLVLDAGTLPKNDPSTVIDTTLSVPVTLRTGNENISKQLFNNNKVSLTSNSEIETQQIAGKLLLKHWNDIVQNGLVIALDGDLGVGKTIFTKGSAHFLKIEDIIKSPTYSYIEEYNYTRYQTRGKLYHLDMWKVETQDMFDRLEITKLFGQKNIIIIEWFNQIKNFALPLLNKIPLIEITITQSTNNIRKIVIKEPIN